MPFFYLRTSLSCPSIATRNPWSRFRTAPTPSRRTPPGATDDSCSKCSKAAREKCCTRFKQEVTTRRFFICSQADTGSADESCQYFVFYFFCIRNIKKNCKRVLNEPALNSGRCIIHVHFKVKIIAVFSQPFLIWTGSLQSNLLTILSILLLAYSNPNLCRREC